MNTPLQRRHAWFVVQQTLLSASILLSVTLQCGCGGRYDASVHGTVTLDGAALTTGTVVFYPVTAGPTGQGRIGADGSYTLSTGSQHGLATGDYRVTVVATDTVPRADPEQAPNLLTPARYGDPKRSDLRFTVQTGTNQIDLPLQAIP